MKVFKRILIAIIIVIALIVAIPQTRELSMIIILNNIETTVFKVSQEDETELIMNGEINSKTFIQLKEVLHDNPSIKTIVLENVPGSLDDSVNLEMCHWVRKQGLNTKLLTHSDIASGGVDFFMAGVKRYYTPGAMIGVHSWSDGVGTEAKDLDKDHQDHQVYTIYTSEMLGSEEFYWYTIYAASAEDIHYMSFEDITKYSLYTDILE